VQVLRFWIILGELSCPFFVAGAESRFSDGEHSSSTSATLKRRIQALVLFASTSLTPSEPDGGLSSGEEEGGNTTDIITRLLDLAALPTGHGSESDGPAIVVAAQIAMERIMNAISAGEFLTAASTMLTSEDTKVRFYFYFISLATC
jgi:U3 small nucleolar RNA-associated protein 10